MPYFSCYRSRPRGCGYRVLPCMSELFLYSEIRICNFYPASFFARELMLCPPCHSILQFSCEGRSNSCVKVRPAGTHNKYGIESAEHESEPCLILQLHKISKLVGNKLKKNNFICVSLLHAGQEVFFRFIASGFDLDQDGIIDLRILRSGGCYGLIA